LPGSRLDVRNGNGRLSFNWYRIKVTIPDRVGSFDPTGSTAVFEVVVDDYAEVWVNGNLPIVLGQTGGPLIKGFNAPNRVVLGRDVRPGQQFQLAVFGMNGPLSNPPGNFIWVRSATIDFYRPDSIGRMQTTKTEITRRDASLDDIVPAGAQIERLASGFLFTEGPVWIPRTATTDGYLLFSDPNANTIYRWSSDGQVTVFRTKSGYTGVDIGDYGQPGSNGLTLDLEGRLTINEHGNRRVTRLEKTGALTVLADRYQGRRLNSPNDLVYRSDGALYFSDPPFGLPKFFEDARKELLFSGVFCLIKGELKLVSRDLAGPNGLAFSPDERYLYVGNWDPAKKVVMRYEVRPDGDLAGGRVFFDMTSAPGDDAIDGIKVDQRGNLYVSGPGGLWILSPEGKHLGTLRAPEHPHNMAWGDDDGRTLYLTAQTSVYRVRLNVPGVRP
jgi:gluconolactonase